MSTDELSRTIDIMEYLGAERVISNVINDKSHPCIGIRCAECKFKGTECVNYNLVIASITPAVLSQIKQVRPEWFI